MSAIYLCVCLAVVCIFGMSIIAGCPQMRVDCTYLSAPAFNPFAPGDFAEKRVLKLVEWFSGHCRAIKG